jgi:hypothetical protein
MDFYKSGRSGLWWDDQLDGLQRGLLWCSQKIVNANAFRYRLNGFSLEPAE